MASQAIPVTGGMRTCDPLTADTTATLEALSADWGAVYEVGYADSRWLASRKDGTGETLRGKTPDDLMAALRADWCSWPGGTQ